MTSPTTHARELFCAMLWTAPLLRADAAVVLCGEDAVPRLATGVELLRAGAAGCLVLSGGRHEPPKHLGAPHMAIEVLALGVAPDRVLVEDGSQNTHEQAVNVLELARANAWKRLLLVASPYHLPRAMLTFLRVATATPRITHIVPVACASVPWFQAPAGHTAHRNHLLSVEFAKIAEYQRKGHCATYQTGLTYLQATEGA